MALFKEVVDLSHEMFNNMLGVSATSMAAFWPVETHERSAANSQGQLSTASKMILVSEHISTHFDAPYHFDPQGLTADRYPLEKLILPGHLLDFTAKGIREAITQRDFEMAVERSGRSITPGTALMAWTGQDRNWGKPGFAKERPYVDRQTALWLVDQGISLFGSDLIGIDPVAKDANHDPWFHTRPWPVAQNFKGAAPPDAPAASIVTASMPSKPA